MNKYLLSVLSLCFSSLLFGQVGNLDQHYGDNGIKIAVKRNVDISNYSPVKSYPADDGGSYTIYSINHSNYAGQTVIVKYLKDGTVDPAYGDGGYAGMFDLPEDNASIIYEGSVRQQDGRITIIGFTSRQQFGRAKAIRYNTDGSVDKSIAIGQFTMTVFSANIQTQDNKVIFWGIQGNAISGLFYYNTILNPDNSTKNVSLIGGFYYSDRYYSDQNSNTYYIERVDETRSSLKFYFEAEKVVVEGPLGYNENVTNVGNTTVHYRRVDYGARRYNSDGTPDETFGDNGKMPYGAYTFPVLKTDGYIPIAANNKKVVLSQETNPSTGDKDFLVTIYDQDGTLDKSFGTNGSTTINFGANATPTSYVWQGDDLIVGGNFIDAAGKTSFALARLNRDGTLDKTFDSDGKQLTFKDGYSFNLQRLVLQQKESQNRLLAVGDETLASYILEDKTSLNCIQNKIILLAPGAATATITEIDPTLKPTTTNAVASYTFSGATEGRGTGSASGKIFNKGATLVSYKVAGNPTQVCSFAVTLIDPGAPLPVKLVDFQGQILATGTVQLTWKTASEENSDYFAVERLDESGNYTEIGKLEAKGSNATYSFLDMTPSYGTNIYRLRQVDKDGKAMYSHTISINILTVNAVTVSPNPSAGQVKIIVRSAIAEKQKLQIFNVNGSLVYQNMHAGGPISLDLSFLPNGLYFLRIGNEQKQLIIAK